MKMAEELHSPSILTTATAMAPLLLRAPMGLSHPIRSQQQGGLEGMEKGWLAKHPQHPWVFASLEVAGAASL